MKSYIFWDNAVWSGESQPTFRRNTFSLHIQGERVSYASNQHEECSKQKLMFGIVFDPEKKGDMFF
jgi:hypothetical protein